MTNEGIGEYQTFIYSLTHYFEWYPNKEDLFQAGCIGLLTAHKNFDTTRNVKFTTYAYPYIIGEMRKLIREDKGIKISSDITKLYYKIEKVNILLSQQLMRKPTICELADNLELPLEQVVECLKIGNILQSLDEPICEDGKELTLYDTIPNKNSDIDMLIALKEELTKLTPDERKIMEMRYIKDFTQAETASSFGLSQVQVSRQEQKIKAKLRQGLK